MVEARASRRETFRGGYLFSVPRCCPSNAVQLVSGWCTCPVQCYCAPILRSRNSTLWDYDRLNSSCLRLSIPRRKDGIVLEKINSQVFPPRIVESEHLVSKQEERWIIGRDKDFLFSTWKSSLRGRYIGGRMRKLNLDYSTLETFDREKGRERAGNKEYFARISSRGVVQLLTEVVGG